MNPVNGRNHRRKSVAYQIPSDWRREITVLLRQLSGWNRKFDPSRRQLIKRCLVGCSVGIPLFDALVYEPLHIELSTYYLPVAHLPVALNGFRIVQLTDIHRSPITQDSIIIKAIRMANATNPDAVVLTGDFVTDDPTGANEVAEMLSKLTSRLGSYAVLGNHDYVAGAGAVTNALESQGIRCLTNDNVELARGLFLVGLDDHGQGKPDAEAAFRGVGEDSSYVTIAHSPMAVLDIKGRKGLLLTGHTHGGQIRIPFVATHLLPGLVADKYIAGWYLDGNLRTYVNRGIGMTNLPMRFRCRPEVALFVLKSAPGL